MNNENIQQNVIQLQVVNVKKIKTNTLNDMVYSNTSYNSYNRYNSSTDEQMMRALDGKNVALNAYVKDLIREYADKDQEEGYHLWSHVLFTHDRKIILSHLVDSEELKYYCSSPERLDSAFNEYDDTIQHLLDKAAQEVYQDDKESVFEAGCERYKEELEDGWFDAYR